MKTGIPILFLVLNLAVSVCGAAPNAPIIVSFGQNGLLVCSNLTPGTVASVTKSASLNGPWLTDVNGITVATNGSFAVNVGKSGSGVVFYRVLGIPAINPNAGMALIPAGSFTMGDSVGDGLPDAQPINVDISSFYIDTNLVTYSKWRAIFAYATNIGYGFDNVGSARNNVTNQPILSLNWYDAVKWCNARSQTAGLTPVYYTDPAFTQVYTNGDTDEVYPNWAVNGYQLPTEAQWEKAARGGLSAQRFPWGNTISEGQANYFSTNLFSYDFGPEGYNTNFDSGSQPYTSPVGYFRANGYGLNDMAGNLLEWCWDWYGTPYGQPTTNNPTGASSGFFRVVRGGYWGVYCSVARTAYRTPSAPASSGNYIGLRCVKNP